MLPNGVSVHETIFVLSGKPEADGTVDPPGVYYAVELHNTGGEPAEMQTYAYADLRGQTGHDVVAEYDKSLNALVAWNASEPDWVRDVRLLGAAGQLRDDAGPRQGGRRRRPRRAVEHDGRADRPAGRVPAHAAPSPPARRPGFTTSWASATGAERRWRTTAPARPPPRRWRGRRRTTARRWGAPFWSRPTRRSTGAYCGPRRT